MRMAFVQIIAQTPLSLFIAYNGTFSILAMSQKNVNR